MEFFNIIFKFFGYTPTHECESLKKTNYKLHDRLYKLEESEKNHKVHSKKMDEEIKTLKDYKRIIESAVNFDVESSKEFLEYSRGCGSTHNIIKYLLDNPNTYVVCANHNDCKDMEEKFNNEMINQNKVILNGEKPVFVPVFKFPQGHGKRPIIVEPSAYLYFVNIISKIKTINDVSNFKL